MTTVNLSAMAGAGQQFFDNNGTPLSGGKLFSCEAGTTTPQITYTTAAGDVAHTNPIVLDSAGRVPSGQIWLVAGDNYKFVLTTAADVQIASWDNITGINGTGITTNASSVAFTGFKGQVGTVADLAGDDGSDWIGFEQDGSGAVARSAQDKMRETVSPQDFGAVGDGVTDDTAAFDAIENLAENVPVDLCGLMYYVTALPTVKTYFNGYVKYSVDGNTYDARPIPNTNVGNTNVLVGADAGASMPKWVLDKGPLLAYNVTAVGSEALKNNQSGRNNVAIGTRSLYSMQNGRYNVAVGLESQYYCDSDDGALVRGTRNTSIGDNSLRFNVTGRSNQAMGRNAAQCLTDGNFNVALGAAAMGGDAPLALDDTTIVNNTPLTASNITTIGVESGRWANGDGTVAVGYRAAHSVKKGDITAIGDRAAEYIESNSSYNGYELTTGSKSGTFVWSGTSLVLTVAAHGFLAGYQIYATIGSHEAAWYDVSSVTLDTITLTNTFTGTETGSVAITQWVNTTPITAVTDVVAIGRRAAQNGKVCSFGTFVGAFSGANVQGQNNTAVGYLSLNVNANGTNNSALGYSALRLGATGTGNSAVGYFAGASLTGDNNTALGNSALRIMQDGSLATSISNATGVGYNACVSGSSQVQLGSSSTTTYAYGAVQDRSDVRDKADVQDTKLGLAFIERLRPVDYKWDYRDDYFIQDDEGNLVPVPKDGSKKRNRFHHGLIAQDVKRVCEELGIDFGGYQDHAINGGCDVKSIGYTELIAPLIKAVQELSARVKELEAK